MLKKIEIELPNRNKQDKIASILGFIEDKIELNHQMNQTLEEMAMALYKHCFVDFGPFQDGEFVESELGMIPKGWEVVSISDLGDFINGGAFKQKELNESNTGLPVIKIAELKSGITDSTKFFDRNYKEKYLIETGDILFAWSASLGVYAWSKGQALLNQHIFNVKPHGELSKSMLYFTLKNVVNEFINIASGRATTMGHITRKHLEEKKIAIPSKNDLLSFQNKFDNIYDLIISLEKEKQKLQQTRDYLLPKLLSGEIDVSEAQETVQNSLS